MEARKQAEKLKLFERINPGSIPLAEVTFGVLARSYIQIKLGENAIKPKASTTAYTEQLIFANNLLPRWEETVATTMEPYDIELWLQAISIDSKEPEKSGCKKQDEEDCKERQNQAGRSKKAKGYEWDTLTKYRRLMSDVFKHGSKHKLIPKDFNPMKEVNVKASSSDYVAMILQPKETFSILNSLPVLQQTMAVLDAATGLRYSEIAGLQWRDIDWDGNCIHVERRWIRGDIDEPKTATSKAPVAISEVVAAYLIAWRRETKYAKDDDWVFASNKNKGKTPRVGNMLVRDYLYPAAVKAGVFTETIIKGKKYDKKKGKEVEVPKSIYFDRKGKRVKRFGFHTFRHSLCSFLCKNQKEVSIKTAQSTLRHSTSGLMLDRYAHSDNDDLLAAQQLMMNAIFTPSQ